MDTEEIDLFAITIGALATGSILFVAWAILSASGVFLGWPSSEITDWVSRLSLGAFGIGWAAGFAAVITAILDDVGRPRSPGYW